MVGKKPTAAGICPECNRLKPLDRFGKMRKHAPPESGQMITRSGNCPGSGKKPKGK